jgi:hypothetical protein
MGDAASGGASAGAPPIERPPAGAEPTEASLTAEGPYDVQSYSFGFAIGPDFPGGTIW